MKIFGAGLDAASGYALAHEPAIRLGFFFGTLAVMAGWEAVAPRRCRAFPRWKRWPSNLGIAALNTLAARVVFPTAAVGFALVGEARGWGLFNNLNLPQWVVMVASVAVLDFAIYLQHVMFHAVPALWRLHRMHHADLDFDFTTGARFHPLEILVSVMVKIAAVVVLGAPALGVIIFEILLNGTAMFNHGNIRLPPVLDRVLRWLVVTPDMHRVHHSAIPAETNSNFGFFLPWWDRSLGTYRAQPASGHESMIIGLDTFREPTQLRLDRMLVQPFIKSTSINYRHDE